MLDKCAFWQDFFVLAADMTPEGAFQVFECRVPCMQTPGESVWCLEAGIELNKLEEWCYMFRIFPNSVGIPKEVNPRFHKLMDIARINNMSDEERKNYFSSSLDDNEREDIAKAEAIAKKLLAMGLTLAQVAEGTGLSVEEVEALG